MKPLVSDPGMHHDTCVTHVPWCMSGSLTCGGGENVPGIPGACAPAILRIWQEAHVVPYMISGVHFWTPNWPIHDLHILLCQKSIRVTCCMGVALSWTHTKFPPKTAIAHGSILLQRSLVKHWRLRVSSSTTSSLLPPWSMAPHTMTNHVTVRGSDARIY